jgi:hypothetical protein
MVVACVEYPGTMTKLSERKETKLEDKNLRTLISSSERVQMVCIVSFPAPAGNKVVASKEEDGEHQIDLDALGRRLPLLIGQ